MAALLSLNKRGQKKKGSSPLQG